MGYLGKISAIVTANTGDFKPKLDAAASDVQRFARGVEGTLRSASTSSAKAMDGIFTPIQRAERALQAAFSMKLSFRGFDGYIKNVDELKVRLADLSRRQIDISVSGTSFKSLKELRDVVQQLNSADMEWVRSLGGLASAKALAPAMNAQELARLGKFDKVSSLGDIDSAVSVMSQRQAEIAARRLRQSLSVKELIAGPMEEAAQKYAKLSHDMQAGFGAAMKSAQSSARKLFDEIEAGCDVSGRKFEKVLAVVERYTAAMGRLEEAQKMAQSLAKGTELKFSAPETYDALAEAAKAQNRLGGLSAESVRRIGGRRLVNEQRVFADQLLAARAETEALRIRRDIVASRASLPASQADYLSQLDYRDVTGTSAPASDSARKYASALASQDAARVEGLSQFLRSQFADAMRSMGMSPSMFGQSQSWSKWDIGKQLHLLSNPSESSSKYRLANPLEDKQLQQEIVQRMVGWEMARAAGAKTPPSSSELTRMGAEALAKSGFTFRDYAPHVVPDRNERLERSNQRVQDATANETKRAAALQRVTDELNRQLDEEERIAAAEKERLATEKKIADEVAKTNAELEAASGTFSRRATPVAALLRMRADEELAANAGAFSRRASNLGPGGPGSPPDGTNYFADQLERRARAMAGGDVTSRTEQARAVDRIGQSIASTRGQLDSLPESVRSQFIPAIQQAIDRFATLARLGPAATRQQIAAATREAERLAETVARTQKAFNFGSQFGGPGKRGIELGLQDVQLGGYTAQLQLLQRLLSGVTTDVRSKAVPSFNALRGAITEAAARGTLGLQKTQQQLQVLTRAAAFDIAKATGGNPKDILRQLQRTGDVGRMGVDKFSLAIQQAGFALDDFFSVTGSFDQRLRAIGNNISQIGFIVGGATGLWLTLGVTIGTQVAMMIGKYVFKLEDAKTKQERLKEMTDSLNSSFENQKSIVESLADSYKELGKGVRDATLPDRNKNAVDRRDRAAEIRKQQAESRREMLATAVPEIADLRVKRAGLEKRLKEEASDFAAQADIRRQLQVNRATEDRIVAQFEAGGAERVRRGDAMLNDRTRNIFADATLNDVREMNRAPSKEREILLARDARIAGELTVGLQQIKDAATLAAFEFTGPLSDAIADAQRKIASLGDFVDQGTKDAVTRAGFRLADVVSDAANEILDSEGVANEVSRIRMSLAEPGESILAAESFKAAFEEQQRSVEAARQEAASSAARGRGLSMTPGQRAADELATGFLDIRRNFGQLAEETNGLVNEGAIMAAQRQFAQGQIRGSAPAIFNLADSVQNALMQGPSRAALQANDVTTAQGAAELNRLLRGDDSAKNQDLVELQKQSKALDELVSIAKQNGAPPGIFDF